MSLPIGLGLVWVMAVENLIANVVTDLVSSLRPVRASLPSRERGFGLPRRLRRLAVILHVAVSVGWLGVSLCLLVLGLAARLAKDPGTATVAYRAMAILADTLDAPVSLVALLSGLVLSIGRPWGLTRHYWILAKLVLTITAVPLAIFALPAVIGHAVAAQEAGAPGADVSTANNLVIAPSVAVATYTAIVAISVLKPWGRIRRR